ncbi:MAG: four helix bundle protein [Deltaproteobacteria bacterium]|nr:four helix bundle protein [Deltaproteobacteria bacterium]
MSKLKSYRDLEVWKRSIELVEMVYRLSARFPAEEKFGLTSPDPAREVFAGHGDVRC